MRLYLFSLLVVVLGTLFGVVLDSFLAPIDQVMIYLMGLVVIASKCGRGPSLLCSLLSVSGFNFFFVQPLYTFNVYDHSYWLTFLVMLVTSFVITSQASQLRMQAIFSRNREQHAQTLYALARALTSTRGREGVAKVTSGHIANVFDANVTIWLPDFNNHLAAMIGFLPEIDVVKETGVLQWCYDHGQVAGLGTQTMPSARGLYIPLLATTGTIGVLGIIPKSKTRNFLPEEMSLLETFASILASALERATSTENAEKSMLEAEREKLRNILLSSISHDLRTPLASIAGASSSIAMDGKALPRETICDLGHSIHQESTRLSRIIINLLAVTSLESGTVQLNKQPYFIEELVGSVLGQMEPMLADYTVIPEAEEGLPMVMIDAVLIEQVLVNILENAVKYTPKGSTIAIRIARAAGEVKISIADNGPGIPSGDEKRVFDKFYSVGQKGTGLGLAICYGIIHAHQGRIMAENRPEGGVVFSFTLPVASMDGRLANDPE